MAGYIAEKVAKKKKKKKKSKWQKCPEKVKGDNKTYILLSEYCERLSPGWLKVPSPSFLHQLYYIMFFRDRNGKKTLLQMEWQHLSCIGIH